MILPANLPDAIALLFRLIGDPNLALGLATLVIVLVGSGLATWALLSRVLGR